LSKSILGNKLVGMSKQYVQFGNKLTKNESLLPKKILTPTMHHVSHRAKKILLHQKHTALMGLNLQYWLF
jgi:hypothetical protein